VREGTARAPAPPAGSAPGGQIGPNAIIQTNAELIDRVGLVVARAVLRDAGLERSERAPPTGMVAEDDVRRLFIAVEHRLPTQAAEILHAAGRRTARYLLANRIPRPAQWLIRRLPRRLGARILVRAIQQNAWTFAGSGSVTTLVTAHVAMVSIRACPVCRGVRANAPRCDFHAGTLDGLAAELLGPNGRAREVSCIASGARECGFALEWSERRKGRPM
jgi:divinyl protochlorophyllide a 8-vinyl-reductase